MTCMVYHLSNPFQMYRLGLLHGVILANEIICPEFWDRYLSLDGHSLSACTRASPRNTFIQQCHSFCNNGNDVRWSRCGYFCRKLILLYQSTFAPYITYIYIYIYAYTHAIYLYDIHYTDIHILLLVYACYIPSTMNALVRPPPSSLLTRKRVVVTLGRVL